MPAVPIMSSAVSAMPVSSGQYRTVQPAGTLDVFPTYEQSPGVHGYLPVTSLVTPHLADGPLPLLTSEYFTPGPPGSLENFLTYDILLLDSAATSATSAAR